MKYRVGNKVRLNLKTKEYGIYGINKDSHNNICTITKVYAHDYDIKDVQHTWSVYEEMLSFVDPQMVFSFMEE